MTDTIPRVPVSLALEGGTRDTCQGKRDSQWDSSGTHGPNSTAQQALARIADGTPTGTPAGQTCPRASRGDGARWDSAVPKFGSWPRLMRAATAAAYCDEKSIQSFRRGVGTLYPYAIRISGKGERWLKEDLDAAIESLTGRATLVKDASVVL